MERRIRVFLALMTLCVFVFCVFVVMPQESEHEPAPSVSAHCITCTGRSNNRTTSDMGTMAINAQSEDSFCHYQPAIDCNKPNTFLIYIYTKRKNLERRQLIRNTWGQLDQYKNTTFNLQMFFVLGISYDNVDKATKHQYVISDDISLEEEIEQFQDILLCEFVDSYANLTRKGLAAIKWINSTCDVRNLEFIFKTDDDVYVRLSKLFDLAKEAVEGGSHFLGVLSKKGTVRRTGKWAVTEKEYPEHRFPPYCLGGGYGITRRGFVLLINSVDKVPLFPLEDVFFTGLAVREANPEINITYFSIKYARMSQTDHRIMNFLKQNSTSVNFILGHPTPVYLWSALHNATKEMA